jgi:hypothetical protein
MKLNLIFVFFHVSFQPITGWFTLLGERRNFGNFPFNRDGIIDDNDLWFQQNFDHFDSMNNKTWKQVW